MNVLSNVLITCVLVFVLLSTSFGVFLLFIFLLEQMVNPRNSLMTRIVSFFQKHLEHLF